MISTPTPILIFCSVVRGEKQPWGEERTKIRGSGQKGNSFELKTQASNVRQINGRWYDCRSPVFSFAVPIADLGKPAALVFSPCWRL